jgi:RNA polymerase sigma-70 factor (ECF subfamily)
VHDTEHDILAEARAGSRDAFRQIVERHSASVFRVAYRLTRHEQDAEDVVQETFLKAHAELGRFEGRAALGTWLHTIAARTAIDLMRRRPRRMVAAGDEHADVTSRLASPAPGPERHAAGRELRARLDAVLDELTPLERASFTLRHLEERTIEEICSVLGQSPAATRHSIFRAVAKIRRALAPLVKVTS